MREVLSEDGRLSRIYSDEERGKEAIFFGSGSLSAQIPRDSPLGEPNQAERLPRV